MKTARGKCWKLWKTHFLLSKVRSLKLCPLAILMPLEENPYTVPHLKALNSGQNLWGGQRCGSTLSLWNALLKISILLHISRSQRFILNAFVLSSKFLHFKADKARNFTAFKCEKKITQSSPEIFALQSHPLLQELGSARSLSNEGFTSF